MSDRFALPPKPEDVTTLSHYELLEHLRLSKVNAGQYVNVIPLLEKELASRSPTANYKCAKCAHAAYELQQSRTSRSLLGSVFGVDSAKYTAVVCRRCSYTEFYFGLATPEEQALEVLLGR